MSYTLSQRQMSGKLAAAALAVINLDALLQPSMLATL